jgi:pimeloyl-ACP methyl ester carboxylesterase
MGAAEGPLCVYFHGCPGAPAEAAWFEAAARDAGVRLVALHRSLVAPGAAGGAYFEALAAEVDALSGGVAVRLIGFSLGGFVALQTALRLTSPVSRLDLVSPAGPLESREILDSMAGGPLFRLAMRSPRLFRLTTWAQGLAVRMAPQTVLRGLFAGVRGAEADLAARPEFRASLADLLARSYGPTRAGYVRDILAYVRPWSCDLQGVRAPTRIWQGEADGWAPPALAAALAARLAGAEVTLFPGLGHYSTLFEAMPTILGDIGRAGSSRA